METIPQRHFLITQVVGILEEGIAGGKWQEWLPSERALAEQLHVSRNTLRAAIARLGELGVLEARRPIGTRIVRGGGARVPCVRTRSIGLLSPEPIDLFRPNVALIVDGLRAQFAELGYQLRAYHGEKYFAPQGLARALAGLVEGNPHDCWVLVMATGEVKRWFYEAGVRCVVSGSCGPEAGLPFVDLDYRALCRHAAGQMIARGHRRLVYLAERTNRTGVVDGLRGFLEGAQPAAARGVVGEAAWHQASAASIIRALERLLARREPPTALLVVNPNHYLLVLTWLQRRGLRVPEDISLVCPDHDPFLSFTYPPPTHYAFNARAFARRLFRLIMLVVAGEVVSKRDIRIMPDYVRGATLGEAGGGGDVKDAALGGALGGAGEGEATGAGG
ncbi:MAG: GntR family transcriptional regulator [Opitutaceae bacterium]|nr:GntR family transcriptional regulator [Opitutaceae bacterium]